MTIEGALATDLPTPAPRSIEVESSTTTDSAIPPHPPLRAVGQRIPADSADPDISAMPARIATV